MKRLSLTWILLLATGILASSEGYAQARGTVSRDSEDNAQKINPSTNVARSRKLEEMKAWLTRLPGQFELKGTIIQVLNDSRQYSLGIRGVMECTSIGEGPGVHCLVKASFGNTTMLLGGGGGGTATRLITYNTLNPAVMLFAMDTESLKIKLMLVDEHSISDHLSGLLAGDTVKFSSEFEGCWGSPEMPHCPWALRITAKPDSKVVKVESAWRSGGINFEFQLRRVSEEESPAVPNSSFKPRMEN